MLQIPIPREKEKNLFPSYLFSFTSCYLLISWLGFRSISFPFFFSFNFYGRIAALQCYVTSFCTQKWIRYMCACTHHRPPLPVLDSLPISVTTERWIEVPVLSSRFTGSIVYVCPVVFNALDQPRFFLPSASIHAALSWTFLSLLFERLTSPSSFITKQYHFTYYLFRETSFDHPHLCFCNSRNIY